MKLANINEKKREEIILLSAKHGAKNISVFGSVVRGDESEDSGIDIMVDLEKGRSLLDLSGSLINLQKLLDRKVEIVTEKSLHWYIRDKIRKEAREI